MQRITISLEENLVADFERYLSRRGYRNRSEAMRDLIRERLQGAHLDEHPDGDCLATLTYVYNHQARALASRLTRAQHAQHDLAVSTLHVHLDHDHCLETLILRGPVVRIRAFADALLAEPGVHHGRLLLLPVNASEGVHDHGDASEARPHLHLRPIA